MQPHASELEEAIIGACLIEQEALPLVADKLRPEMFYDDHHQLIFAALIAMYQANKKIDILTVKEELTRRGVLEKIGGPYTIVQLSSRVASSAHIEYHAQIVHQKYLAREAVVGFNKLLTCAMDETIDIDDTLIDAHNLLDRLEGESGHHDHIRCMDTLMTDTLKEAELRIAKSVNGVTGIPTGLTELDQKTGGLQDSDLIVIAARPSVGKTAFPYTWHAVRQWRAMRWPSTALRCKGNALPTDGWQQQATSILTGGGTEYLPHKRWKMPTPQLQNYRDSPSTWTTALLSAWITFAQVPGY